MGYRSSGALYLTADAKKELTEEMFIDLRQNWLTTNGSDYEFCDWKWHLGYEDVKMWEDFMKTLEEKEIAFDFIRIGEDYGDIEIRTGERYYCERSIGYY